MSLNTDEENNPLEQYPPLPTHRVEWSYQTSTNAIRFGFGKVGCWTVEKINTPKPPTALAGFATRAEANGYLQALSDPEPEPENQQLQPCEQCGSYAQSGFSLCPRCYREAHHIL